MSKDLRKELAEKIAEELYNEFAEVHLTGNLIDTIKIVDTLDGVAVEIPAQAYDVFEYYRTGQVIHNRGDESYASDVDINGGFSKVHKGYIDKCIYRAIARWSRENGLKLDVNLEEETNNMALGMSSVPLLGGK